MDKNLIRNMKRQEKNERLEKLRLEVLRLEKSDPFNCMRRHNSRYVKVIKTIKKLERKERRRDFDTDQGLVYL